MRKELFSPMRIFQGKDGSFFTDIYGVINVRWLGKYPLSLEKTLLPAAQIAQVINIVLQLCHFLFRKIMDV